ncbi:TlpA disulfide reductase family protein [Pseudolabrys sp. FHR47]|uniref:TlpA family protein disulfide reductase n=1 Tax=Pseudolabrys sp. FHR47 TaxID=2562284 RepID=UPI00143D2F70|nr:TlpA disulfide reductase family protein [Pseudolabrys sp. FHR47]
MDNNPAHLSRRAALAAVLGTAALPIFGSRGRAQGDDRPPVFQTAKRQFTVVRPSKQLPGVTLADINGRPAQVAPVPGKVLLINIWASWCDACRVDLPLLERFHKTGGRQVEIAAVSVDTDGREHVKSYLEKLSVRALPVYLDQDGRLAGNAAKGAAPLLIYGMPLTYLITPSGRIAGYMAGVADWLAPDAQQLLAYYAAA